MIETNGRLPVAGRVSSGAPTPGLAALGLSNEELCALARQGFVGGEYRGRRGPYFKLRFRVARRQIVKYLGNDVVVAKGIQQEVILLQAEHRLSRQLQRLTMQAREVLRETKLILRDDVRAAGFDFHGLAVRQKTRAPS